MMTASNPGAYLSPPPGSLLPRTTRAAGEPLWGAPPRRQPIVPLVALAFVLLLVAAPAAMSGNGQSANPITLMHSIADTTYTITGLMGKSNATLDKINQNTLPLAQLQVSMGSIAASANGMNEKTAKLNAKLGDVGGRVTANRTALENVDTKLGATAKTMGTLRTNVNGSLTSTKAVVNEFGYIDRSITAMDGNLKQVMALMSVSTPQTKAFAQNRTRVAIAGGDGRRYGVPNIAPGNRVMSVVLPMINTMQQGGPLPARKDSAQGSNPLIHFMLNRQVPDGTNVVAHVQPYDGVYGLPKSDYFVNTRVNGF